MAQIFVNFVQGWPICSFLQLTILGFWPCEQKYF